VVALGVLVFGTGGRRGRRTAHLNDSSCADERTPTIEHNGLLRAADVDPRLTARFARWVLAEHADEFLLPGSADPALGPGVVGAAQVVPAPYVDLARLRAAGVAYPDSLSSNTRGQLRRAVRDYGRAGPLAITAAASVAEARAFLDRLAAFHQARWTARGQPGAFASPFFCRLHETIIEHGAASGAVELLRITAGSREIGYLHNLVRGGWIAAYQNGFAYESDRRAKPGLVSHALAIERAARAGAGRYDFLAGLNQLKQSLANEQENLNWWVIQPARFATRLEYAIISLKSRLKQIRTKTTRNTLLSQRERFMQT
jgi:CelD/BcsL family acetyltransferase involved in cellulose biosynthesis